VRIVTADALTFLSFSSVFSFLFLFYLFSRHICTVFSSVETSAIDFKLQYNVQKGLNSRSNIFWKLELRSFYFQTFSPPPVCYSRDLMPTMQGDDLHSLINKSTLFVSRRRYRELSRPSGREIRSVQECLHLSTVKKRYIRKKVSNCVEVRCSGFTI